MKLVRPLVVFDVETTGTDVAKDRIVSWAAMKVYPDGKQHVFETLYFDPGIPISQEAIDTHGITNEKAAEGVPFEWEAQSILNYFDGCDLAGFNLLNFDIPILWEEFNRAGIKWDLNGISVIDAGNIFKIKERRTLEAAVKFYCGKDHSEAHDAKGDVVATFEVLMGQLSRYSDLGEMQIPDLAKACKMNDRFDLAGKIIADKDGDPSYAFGKCKGVKVKKDPSYAKWMLTADFSEQTKMVIRALI